ncbi:BspA family leucine-rich repeat surface protein [[Acholeplasma] multilocale]|uniref:BspA family leucine-rich repeat surface protein n=1 Tax=[Acholeplasma] multilocale TaxID=264638 RepID=UPI000684328C|nr:BspA family leucine-rich repeat surface protein [[Acholeplasma] multilocale]
MKKNKAYLFALLGAAALATAIPLTVLAVNNNKSVTDVKPVEQLEEELKELNAQLSETKVELETKTTKLNELEERETELTEFIEANENATRITAFAIDENMTVEAAEKELAEVKVEIVTVTEEIKVLTVKVTEIENKVKEKEKEIEEAKPEAKPVDKKVLEARIAEIKAFAKDGKKLTDEAQSAIEAAELVVAKTDATQAEVDASLATLEKFDENSAVEDIILTSKEAVYEGTTLMEFGFTTDDKGVVSVTPLLTTTTEIHKDAKLPEHATSMQYFLRDNIVFDGDLGMLDTSNITNMDRAFQITLSNGESIETKKSIFTGKGLEKWDVSKVTDMGNMFHNAVSFTGDTIQGWTTASLEKMVSTFDGAKAFDGDLGNWDVTKVKDFGTTFYGTSSFTGKGLDKWKEFSATSMTAMFQWASVFNADISGWNVASVTNMEKMFDSASLFDQDLSKWTVEQVVNHDNYDYGMGHWAADKRPPFKG